MKKRESARGERIKFFNYTIYPYNVKNVILPANTANLHYTENFELTPAAKNVVISTYENYFYINVTSTAQPLTIQATPIKLVNGYLTIVVTYNSCTGTTYQLSKPSFSLTITTTSSVPLMTGVWYVRTAYTPSGGTPTNDNIDNNIAIGACYGVDCVVAGMPTATSTASAAYSTITTSLVTSTITTSIVTSACGNTFSCFILYIVLLVILHTTF